MKWLAWLELRDAYVWAGILLLSVGAGLIYMPAALVVAGVVLLTLGVMGVRE